MRLLHVRPFFAVALLAVMLQTGDCSEYLDFLGPPTDLASHEDAGVRAAHESEEADNKDEKARDFERDAQDHLSNGVIDQAIAERPLDSRYRWTKAAIAVANGDLFTEADAISRAKALDIDDGKVDGNEQSEQYINALARLDTSMYVQNAEQQGVQTYSEEYEPPSEQILVQTRLCETIDAFDRSNEGWEKRRLYDQLYGRTCDSLGFQLLPQ